MGTLKNIWVPHESAPLVDQTSDDALRSMESVTKGSNDYFKTVTSSISIIWLKQKAT